MKKPGFSIIELLVVIAIISVLVGMIFLSAFFLRNRATNSKIDGDLSMLKIALMQYQKEKDMLPDVPTLGKWCKIGVDSGCLNLLVDNGYVGKLQKGPNDKCSASSSQFDKECYYYYIGSNFVSVSGIKTPAKYGDFVGGPDCNDATKTTGGTKRFCVGVMK